jgi:hypothetical protein
MCETVLQMLSSLIGRSVTLGRTGILSFPFLGSRLLYPGFERMALFVLTFESVISRDDYQSL